MKHLLIVVAVFTFSFSVFSQKKALQISDFANWICRQFNVYCVQYCPAR